MTHLSDGVTTASDVAGSGLAALVFAAFGAAWTRYVSPHQGRLAVTWSRVVVVAFVIGGTAALLLAAVMWVSGETLQ